MEIIKRFLIGLCLLCTLSGFAATEVGGIWYNFTDSTAEVTYKERSKETPGYTGDLMIPNTINYEGKSYTVTSIGRYAFSNCNNLTSITIPENITTIKETAFLDCENLTSIIVESGNPNYFSENGILFNKDKTELMRCLETKVGDFVIPEGVETIAEGAFYNCTRLTSILIPNTVKTIKNESFTGINSVSSIVIPPSVTNIGLSAFIFNSGLTEITLPFVGTSANSTDNAIFTSMFSGNTALKKVTISEPCTTIQNNAFNGSKLTEIILPNTITTIDNSAFHSCKALTSITLPENVRSIGAYAFYGCDALTSIKIPENVKSIEPATFYGCSKLTSVILPENLDSIGNSAFHNCDKLASIFIPKSVIKIGDLSFIGCDNGKSEFSSINVDSENVNYSSEDGVLFNKDKTLLICYPRGKGGDYTIPNGVTTIGNEAFLCCSTLVSVTIPPSVTAIKANAFYGCSNLASIDIPQSITTVTGSAFDQTKWMDNQPDGVVYIGKVLYKYKGEMPEYTEIEILEGTTSIENSAFYNCENLFSVFIPGSVSSIGNYAFYGCNSLHSISIPNSVSTIGSYAFYGCGGLTSINIPNKVTAIERSTFMNCTGLTSVVIPASVTSIKEMAFNGCTALNLIGNFNPVPVELPYDFDMGVFDGFKNTCMLYVPKGSLSAYQNKEQWKEFNIVEMSQNPVPDSCVVINGVAWATRNVDLPGTFADSGSAGKFYQWNRTIAWSITDPLIGSNGETTWDTTYPDSTWNKEYDPSPAGYRVPTLDEIQRLVDYQKVSKEVITQNGVKGVKFIDNFTGNSIFVPLTGTRATDGRFLDSQTYYWSSTSPSKFSAYTFYANDSGGASYSLSPFASGFLLRPVAANIDPFSVISVHFNKTALHLNIGYKEQLAATLLPEIAVDKTTIWTSSDNRVATVNSEGLITAVAAGRTTITATSVTGRTATCTVTVTDLAGIPENIEINGVVWATRNVDDFGTFAENPESYGMLYQWNRNDAWSVTGEAENWDSSMPTDDVWEEENNPTPAGYRLPSIDEIQSLLDESNVSNEWTSLNGINGRLFTDKTTGNTLFLPASGSRNGNNSKAQNAGYAGTYWSNTSFSNNGVYTLHFSYNYIEFSYNYNSGHARNHAFPIRPVVDVTDSILSSNANLLNVFMHGNHRFDVVFEEGQTSFYRNVPFTTESLCPEPNPEDSKSNVSGDLGCKDLQEGDNIFTFTVTAEDGKTQKTYTITINRSVSEAISIIPSEENILITWELIENAEGYLLKIYNDEAHTQLEQTLQFDANGQFVAELRSGSTDEPFSYTLKDLLSGTTYYYAFEAIAANNEVLLSQSGKFTTTGETVGVVEPLRATSLPSIIGYYNILGVKLSEEPKTGFYIVLYSDGKAEKIVK